MKKYNLFRGLALVLAFLMMTSIGLTISMFENEGHVNHFLGTTTSKLVLKDENAVADNPIRFPSKYAKDITNFTQEEMDAKSAAADEFIEREMEASAVLLKNDKDALPLSSEEIKKVSLFGRATVDPHLKSQSGGGEGGTGEKVYYLDALKERGFVYNEKLVEAYNNDKSPKTTYEHLGESPISIYTNDVKASFAGTDVAIVMLSRTAGESHDLITYYTDSDGEMIGMLELSKNERDMMSLVKEYKDNGTFKKVIVILNTSNPLEVNWLDDYGVDACMWIGGPGRGCGFRGVADILKGDSNPSGRLTDTYAANSMSAPATLNFGSFRYTNGGNYVVYLEGIYVGYKYYETRYEDCVLGQGNANGNAGVWESDGSWNYAEEMSYPFGYGLSYTTFEKTLDKVVENENNTLTATVTVKNTGTRAGKYVVELYAQTPYGDYEKQNLVEKAAIQLVGFDKTKELAPNESETLEIVVDKYFLASYDYKNAKTYILSEGDYYLAVGDDAHDALNNVLAKKGASGMFDIDGNPVSGDADLVYKWSEQFDDKTYSQSVTGAKVTNKLDDCDVNFWLKDKLTYLTRQDWQGTYPEALRGELSLTKTADMVEIKYVKPEGAPTVNDVIMEKDAGLKFADMWGIEFENELWNTFVDQLSLDDIITLVLDMRGINNIESITFPGATNADGPDGIPGGNAYVTFNLSCASWDTEILKERGEFIAEDCLFNKVQFLWGPGLNTHRSPYGARNFEYPAEDGYLGYKLGAANIAAMQENGLNVGIKHFFANDQDTHRGGVNTFATEQTFRELGLRMFEGSVVEGKTHALMAATNNVGIHGAERYDAILEDILRDEWGFVGIVITDAGNARSIETIVYGTNMFCFCDKKTNTRTIQQAVLVQDDGHLLNILKDRAKETLYAYANSNVMNGLTSDYMVVPVTPWWKIFVVCVDVAFGLGMTAMVALFAISAYKNKDKEDA